MKVKTFGKTIYTHTYIHMCIYIYMHTHTYVCIYTCIHTHTYTHTHIHPMRDYPAIKKNEMTFAATWMDWETVILSKICQKEKGNTIWYHSRVKSKIQMNTSTKQKQTHRHREPTCGCQWEGRVVSFGISRCKLFYVGWINNKVLLYSTVNYIQYPIISHNERL